MDLDLWCDNIFRKKTKYEVAIGNKQHAEYLPIKSICALKKDSNALCKTKKKPYEARQKREHKK